MTQTINELNNAIDNTLEVKEIPNSELRIYESPWGHCVASPGNDNEFALFLD